MPGFAVELTPSGPWFSPRNLLYRIYTNAFHAGKVAHQTTVADCVTGDVMGTTTHCAKSSWVRAKLTELMVGSRGRVHRSVKPHSVSSNDLSPYLPVVRRTIHVATYSI